MPDKAWKAFEREIAKRLGGQRAGPLGREGPDVLHPLWAPECKMRKKLPRLLTEAMDQAVTNTPPGKIPLVILHQAHDEYDQALVVMRLRDFEDWFVGENEL